MTGRIFAVVGGILALAILSAFLFDNYQQASQRGPAPDESKLFHGGSARPHGWLKMSLPGAAIPPETLHGHISDVDPESRCTGSPIVAVADWTFWRDGERWVSQTVTTGDDLPVYFELEQHGAGWRLLLHTRSQTEAVTESAAFPLEFYITGEFKPYGECCQQHSEGTLPMKMTITAP